MAQLLNPIELEISSQISTLKLFDENLVVGCIDGSVRVLDLVTQKWKSEIEAHTLGVNEVLWDRCGKYIFSCADDGTTQIRDISGQLMTTLFGHTNYVQSLSIDPKNLLILSGGNDCSVFLWDIRNISEINSFFHIHRETITSVDFSKDSSVFLTASYDGTMHVWDTMSLNSIKTISYSKNAPISRAKFVGDNGLVASACLTNKIYMWDIEEIKSLPLRTYTGHKNERFKCQIQVSDDNQSIWSGSEDGNLYGWDLQSQQVINTIRLAEENAIVHAFDIKSDLIVYTTHNKGETKDTGSLVISKFEKIENA
ncbi:unnamed protein product [Blepharisma stoltei]|uniref:Uncharacterized protein n=1 Tax=Blepharisma stoltei TaxID=1481888 RepID=A0AAU9IS39_9CILI|nr:unnamed protein product [Blepharisma stoltei]